MKMKFIRRWSRILHRDLGYLFIGTSLIYGLSGIALNHLNDWDPNYSVGVEHFTTNIDMSESPNIRSNVIFLLDEIDNSSNLKSFTFREDDILRIYLKGGSSALVNAETGKGWIEKRKKRAVFYQVNFLHYNPHEWWMWFSDIFAGGLIFLALISFFMVKGKKGIWGRGGIYTLIGIIIPIIFLILLQ